MTITDIKSDIEPQTMQHDWANTSCGRVLCNDIHMF